LTASQLKAAVLIAPQMTAPINTPTVILSGVARPTLQLAPALALSPISSLTTLPSPTPIVSVVPADLLAAPMSALSPEFSQPTQISAPALAAPEGQALPASPKDDLMRLNSAQDFAPAARSYYDGSQLGEDASASPVLAAPAQVPQAAAHARLLSAAPSQSYTLLTQPNQANRTQIIDLLNGAKKSITLTIYEIEDPQTIAAMIAAAKRGVSVQVLYNFYSFKSEGHDPNAQFIAQLNAGGVKTQQADQKFTVTHQKTFVVDGKTAVIMTFNLAPNYFTNTRDFGIITTDPGQVAEISKVFAADWANQSITPSQPALVWSPNNSRAKILAIINGAAKTLEVYNEEASDKECMQALIAAAKRGVKVRFITAILKGRDSPDGNAAERATLNANGVQAKGLAAPYIHAKMILADYGTANAKVFLGSENFSQTSLDKNRELGIIMTDSAIMSSISGTFESDWSK
jgi:phosphatidylserine/phosphatidylglycerophosphate/cardiolipin synthase-like enzyme